MQGGQDDATVSGGSSPNGSDSNRNGFVGTVATIGVIGVGAALIEASLIPGIVIGVAAAFVPKYLPLIGSTVQPMFKSAVRGAYKLSRKTRNAVADAQKQVRDIVSEVHADAGAGSKTETTGHPPA